MFKKQLLYPLLLLASLAHGDAILVMMTEELKPLINPQKMVSPEYDGKVIERVIDIETVFDIREELNSPKNVKTLHNLIQVVDHDNLLDGVILVGDFPMPTPHFSSEPEYEAITEHTGFTSPYADHLYI